MGRPDFVLLPEDLDQPALEQRLHHRAGVHPAHVLDLRAGDRLPVGDDGQRLERGTGQPLRLHPEEPPHELPAVGVGPELPAAGHLGEDDAADPVSVNTAELPERLLQPGPVDAGRLVQLVERDRLVGHEEERLDHRPHPLRREAAAAMDDPLEGLEIDRLLVDLGGLDVLQLDVGRWRGHRLDLGLAERHRRARALVARLLRSTHGRRPPGSRSRVHRPPPTPRCPSSPRPGSRGAAAASPSPARRGR